MFRASLSFVLLSLPLACATQKTAPVHTKQGRVPDNPDFTLELRSVYYDEQWTDSDRRRGPVARFRFHNRTRSVLQVYGSYLTIHHNDQITESKTALRSTCNSLQDERGILANNPADRRCWPNAIDLLPSADYTIDVELFQFTSKVEAKAAGRVVIDGPEKMFVSATFELERLVSVLPEQRQYPANGDLPIPTENRFVMSFDAVRDLAQLGGEKLSTGAYFAPSEVEVLDANRAILRSLLAPEGSEMFCDHSGCQEFVVNFLDQYCVQYWGRVERKAGRRIVDANFFLCHKGALENEYPERSTDIVSAKGGGARFWAASYDIASRKLLTIHANASK